MISTPRLLEALTAAKLIDTKQSRAIQKNAQATKKDAYDCIRESEAVPDVVLGQLMGDLYAVQHVDLANRAINRQTLRIIPEVIARHQLVIPFSQDDQYVNIAMFDPQRNDMIAYIEKLTGKKAIVWFATKENIRAATALYRSSLREDIFAIINNPSIESKRIVQLVNMMIEYAFANRSSDIHIEPQEGRIVIRFRIDGELHDVAEIPPRLYEEIVTRIKILGKMRTDEHRSAQDGGFQYTTDDQRADIRVSVVPITRGEKIVMRILSEESRRFTLEQLGFKEQHLGIVMKSIERPYGMILATGPTGSGKTTTLYAMMKKLNSRAVNISTIEDPVEYTIDGVNQIQVNPKTNLTFSQGLKSILRQDPDIIMVGEIRDKETASIAINAAMTGHLVLSTLHTNDAATALPRLLDMGIEPFLIASTLNVIVAQRLVRKLNTKYMESYLPSKGEIDRLMMGLSEEEKKDLKLSERSIRLYRPKTSGIPEGHEYEGRIGIFEVMEISEEIKSLIMSRANSDVIRSSARTNHMHSMYFDGLKKALEGLTTIEEIFKATLV